MISTAQSTCFPTAAQALYGDILVTSPSAYDTVL